MSEETPTPPDQLPQEPTLAESDEVFDQKAVEINRNLTTAQSSESAQRLFGTPEENKDDKKNVAGTGFSGKQLVGIGAAAAVAVTGVSLASSAHMDTVLDNMSGQIDPNQHHDFENGPLPTEESEAPGPMNPAESPAPNEIPSPVQQSVDVQLPTLPSPEQK